MQGRDQESMRLTQELAVKHSAVLKQEQAVALSARSMLQQKDELARQEQKLRDHFEDLHKQATRCGVVCMRYACGMHAVCVRYACGMRAVWVWFGSE
jgi:hypothetical protein